MKPLQLTLRGFGAYAGEHGVPFAELAELGLFTVSGPTGSGKTTLFDAMAYALYGGLPGDRPAAEVRSHHAADETITEVSLEFEVAGERWRVERSPEQIVRGARKVRRQAAEARLYHWRGTGWQGVETGPRRVDPRVEAIVGLTLHQFERVILLPQGKFQQFLLTGTRERRLLLRHLFGTELYERASDELLARATALRDQLAASDETVRHHLANARGAIETFTTSDTSIVTSDPNDPASDVGALRGALAAIAPVVERAESALHELETRQAAAQLAAQRADDLATRWDRRTHWQARQRAHTLEGDAIADARRRLRLADAAAPVVAAARASERLRAQLAEVGRRSDEAHARLSAALIAAALPTDGSVTEAELTRRIGSARAAAVAFSEHRTTTTELAQVSVELQALATRRAELDEATTTGTAAIADAHERLSAAAALAGGLGAAEAEAQRAQRLLAQREAFAAAEQRAATTIATARRASELLDTVTRRFVRGIAPRLAAALRDDEPCPVCGASEHPAPATDDPDAALTGPAELEQAQADAQAAMAEQGRAASDLHLLGLELGLVTQQSIDEVRTNVARAASALQAARFAVVDAESAQRGLDALHTSLAAIGTEQSAIEVRQARLEERQASLGETCRRLRPTVDEWADIDLDARVRALGDVTGLLAGAHAADHGRALARARTDDGATAVVAALAVAGFDSIEAALDAAIDDSPLAAMRADVERWQREGHEIGATLQALDADVLPDERPEPGDLRRAATDLAAAVASERAAVLRIQHDIRTAGAALDAVEQETAASASVRLASEQAEVVARTCAGQGPGRIALESWVLATELDRVAAAANAHLARMSAGRYQLVRTDDAGHAGKQAGLDLAVLDSHTGRERPATTLSGGEQFQASLALALGLADVVGQTAAASAAGFDALFVDEGFGSLDPDALDLAIGALDELRGGGRIVGVITHVEAMKAALPIGVEVRPLPDGRGSTLSVLGRNAAHA